MTTIKIRVKRQNDAALVRMIITHPMDTGRKRDSVTGELIPAHYIESLQVEHNGQIVADCRFTTAVSRDPYLSVRVRPAKAGDRIRVHWSDNRGQSDSTEALIE